MPKSKQGLLSRREDRGFVKTLEQCLALSLCYIFTSTSMMLMVKKVTVTVNCVTTVFTMLGWAYSSLLEAAITVSFRVN